MATVTSSYAIGVTIDADGTGFVTGTQAAEQAMTDLATQTAIAGTEIDTTLTTDVPTSVDNSAFAITTKAAKFKAVGTELGTNLAGGIAGGASAPEAAAATASSMTGLLAASADTAKGALALVGLGIGVSVVTNMIKGIQERKQAAIDAFNSLFASIEVEADQSARKIKASILEAFDFEDALTQLGGTEGLQGGLRKVNELVDTTGASFDEVVDVLRGNINPANRDTLQLLREQSKEIDYQVAGHGNDSDALTDNAKLAGEILEKANAQRDTNNEILRGKKQEVGYQEHINTLTRDTADLIGKVSTATGRSADAADRYAAALERADAAASRLNDRAGLNGNADTAR